MRTIKNAHGRYIDHFDLYPLLGFGAGQHLPREGFAPREIQGVLIKLDPAPAPIVRYDWRSGQLKPRNQSRHRIRQQCDVCQEWVPFGRVTQHKCLSLTNIRRRLAKIGITIWKRDDEYRVNFRAGREATAYYTNDIEDALNTGFAMKDAPR